MSGRTTSLTCRGDRAQIAFIGGWAKPCVSGCESGNSVRLCMIAMPGGRREL